MVFQNLFLNPLYLIAWELLLKVQHSSANAGESGVCTAVWEQPCCNRRVCVAQGRVYRKSRGG